MCAKQLARASQVAAVHSAVDPAAFGHRLALHAKIGFTPATAYLHIALGYNVEPDIPSSPPSVPSQSGACAGPSITLLAVIFNNQAACLQLVTAAQPTFSTRSMRALHS